MVIKKQVAKSFKDEIPVKTGTYYGTGRYDAKANRRPFLTIPKEDPGLPVQYLLFLLLFLLIVYAWLVHTTSLNVKVTFSGFYMELFYYHASIVLLRMQLFPRLVA